MRSKKIQNITIAIISTVITTSTILLATELSGRSIIMPLWYLKVERFGDAEIGIWQDDPVLGWVHKPNSKGNHFKPLTHNVTYQIDEHGHRITEGEYSLPKILFLGGSFTFGHGVEDNEPFPSLLQEKYPQYKIINAGVMAWGTGQALLKLREQLTSNNDIKLVVYAFTTYHLERNYLRQSWLKSMEEFGQKRNPYFEIIDGELVFKGLADPDKNGITDEEYLQHMEREMTLKMLEEMKKLCDASSIPFVFIYLPDGLKFELSPEDISAIVGSEFFYDLRKEIDYAQIRFKYDVHPTARGHLLIAQSVEPILQKLLFETDFSVLQKSFK